MAMISWTNLPEELMRLITEKLIQSDRVSINLSCKRWYNSSHDVRNPNEVLPWLMSYDDGLIKLFDPAAQTTYALKSTPELLKYDWAFNWFPVRRDPIGPTQHDDWVFKHNTFCPNPTNGWVLFIKKLKSYPQQATAPRCVFFYSPFAAKVIELPPLFSSEPRILQATFSSVPTSPDCVTILTAFSQIIICKMGDEKWKHYPFKVPFRLSPIVCWRNSIYCWVLFSRFMLEFDLGSQEWKSLPDVPGPENFGPLNIFIGFNGDVMLINMLLQTWRLDMSKLEWIRVGLENQILFQNPNGGTLSIPAIGNAKEFGGAVTLGGRVPGRTVNPNFPYPQWENSIWIQSPFQTNFVF